MIKILYFSRTSRDEVWEYDFIQKEILTGIKFTPYYLSLDQIRESNLNFDIVVYSCRDPSEYYWGYMPTYNDILECVQKVNPKIIIQLSDEYSHENLDHHNNLCKHCDLMLRQYWHSDRRNAFFGTQIPEYKNLIHIPLGYGNDFFLKRKDIRPVSERKYSWSFVGKIKDEQFFYFDYEDGEWKPTTNRQEMIDVFKSEIGNYFFEQSGVSKKQLADVCNDSIFILCGRGNTSLNCFRNYECTLSGAIPVVVYRYEDECDNTFKFNKKPPWLYASSWEEAAEKCSNLLNMPDVLQCMQDENFKWWDSEILYIKRRVSKVLKEF